MVRTETTPHESTQDTKKKSFVDTSALWVGVVAE